MLHGLEGLTKDFSGGEYRVVPAPVRAKIKEACYYLLCTHLRACSTLGDMFLKSVGSFARIYTERTLHPSPSTHSRLTPTVPSLQPFPIHCSVSCFSQDSCPSSPNQKTRIPRTFPGFLSSSNHEVLQSGQPLNEEAASQTPRASGV